MSRASLAAAVACLAMSSTAQAGTIVIDPTTDGTIWNCAGCLIGFDGGYVVVAEADQGFLKFSSAGVTEPVTSAVLSLNPYALPLFDLTLDIYGYGTSIAAMDISDRGAGAFLGTMNLPSTLGYGEEAFFDVTAFIQATTAPFYAFSLRSDNTNVFSSLEYNLGRPAQLTVTTTQVPEPGTLALLGIGMVGVAFVSRRRRQSESRLQSR